MKCRNFGKDNKLLLFDILEYIVEQGNMNTWVAVSSPRFLSFIIEILRSQSDAEIQTQLLHLIQNWGTDFENKKNVIPNFYKVYNKFKDNGVVFPPREEPNYYKYILKNDDSDKNYKKEDNYEDNKKDDYQDEPNDYESNDDNEFAYIDSIKNKLKVSNFEHKYRRLVTFLIKMHDNIKIANICIDKRKLSDLKEPINTIKKGNKTIMDTISSGRLKDEKLMEITLGTTEDINQTLSREEEMKSGCRPNKFISYFVLNEIIPIKNTNSKRAKSEKKKGILNPRNNMNRNEDKNDNMNKNSSNNIRNVDDIFDLFSTGPPKNDNQNSNFNNNMFNNNNNQGNNNMISNYYSNQNQNNNFFDDNQNNNNFMNNNYSSKNVNNRINNNMNNSNNNFNQNNNNNNNNQMNNFDLLQGSINVNNQQNDNNFQNNNNQNKIYNPNEFDMYGPAPEINSNQLIHYIGPIDNNNNNNNNQYPTTIKIIFILVLVIEIKIIIYFPRIAKEITILEIII